MRRMFKWDLPVGRSTIEMPAHYICHVACQFPDVNPGVVSLWAEVVSDDEAVPEPNQPYTFEVVGTGHPIPEGGRYLGTAIGAFGSLVWHVYECELF